MESKRVYVTLGKTLANVQRMIRVSALTNTMKLIETVQRAEVVVVAQDQADQAVLRKEKARKEGEKAKEEREIKLPPPRTADQSHVTFT